MKAYVSLFFLLLVTMVGCTPPPVEEEPQPSVSVEEIQETQEIVKQARENVEALQHLQADKTYSQEFREAHDEFIHAENALQEELYEQARQSAQKSLKTSQKVLEQFYQDTIVPSAQEAKTKIRTITAEDSDNPLEEFLPTLDNILDYSDEVTTGQQNIDARQVVKDFEKIAQVEQSANALVRQTLESDVSFAPGEYDLSEKGKRVLETFAEAIITNKEKYNELYPDKEIFIKIKVVGYSDQVDFNEGTTLLKRLMEGFEDRVPQTQPERRKFFNQRLSEFRARTISQYIVQYITQEVTGVHIKQESIGLGEELPPGVSPSYSPTVSVFDPQRRMCRIYGFVTAR